MSADATLVLWARRKDRGYLTQRRLAPVGHGDDVSAWG